MLPPQAGTARRTHTRTRTHTHTHMHTHSMHTRTRTRMPTRMCTLHVHPARGDACAREEQAVGSHALMLGSGFEHLDAMQIAKFAEGESFVLMQKLVSRASQLVSK